MPQFLTLAGLVAPRADFLILVGEWVAALLPSHVPFSTGCLPGG